MRCDEVRAQLPELAEAGLRAVGEAEEHLASCPDCSLELERYRRVLSELGTLTAFLVDPGAEMLARILADVPPSDRVRLLRRALADDRVHRAALSLGGAVVGATAVALVWWRLSRRPMSALAGTALAPGALANTQAS